MALIGTPAAIKDIQVARTIREALDNGAFAELRARFNA